MGLIWCGCQDASNFDAYIKETKNTICGKNPISILLESVQHARTSFVLRFVHYAQSNQCTSEADSSVSYASGVLFEEDTIAVRPKPE